MSGLHLGPGLHLSLSPTSLALGKGVLIPQGSAAAYLLLLLTR